MLMPGVKGTCEWVRFYIYHHREDHRGSSRFDDPQQHQAGELNYCEYVNLPQRHVSQVDQVRLVLCRHPKQLNTVKELQRNEYKQHEHKFIIILDWAAFMKKTINPVLWIWKCTNLYAFEWGHTHVEEHSIQHRHWYKLWRY